MTAPISIGELEAAERALTGKRWCVQGPWPQATVYVDDEAIDDDSLHPTHVATMATLTGPGLNTVDDPDAAGIVALRNAAPVLLAIAKAALELFAMTVDEDSDDATMELMNSRKRALLDALKAVRP